MIGAHARAGLTIALLTIALLARGRVAAQAEPSPVEASEGAAAAEAPPGGSAQPPPPSAADSTAGAGDEFTASAADLAELGLATEGGETLAIDTSLRIYGFVDFGVSIVFADDNWRNAIQAHPSFFIGNFNIYVAKNLTDTFRMMSEVRFTYLPNGRTDLAAGTIVSTVAEDYVDFQRPLRWGTIEIERVYLEWSMTPWLALRLGQFLTPYGIWNVDHGSPTVIPVIRPYAIGMALFPERQTGLELRGQVSVSARHSIGYHLTLSNGIGPVSEYRDLDDNKAIGARAYWSYEGLGQLTIGTSGFFGTDADTRLAPQLDSAGDLAYGETINYIADVVSLAGDVKWTYDGFLVQSEFMTRQTAYRSNGRPVLTHPLTGRRIAIQDTFDYGGYVLTGYRFDWLGVMPYFMFNYQKYVEPQLLTNPNPLVFEAGLNIRPIDSVVFKVQYQVVYWPGGFVISDDPLTMLFFQLAWAF